MHDTGIQRITRVSNIVYLTAAKRKNVEPVNILGLTDTGRHLDYVVRNVVLLEEVVVGIGNFVLIYLVNLLNSNILYVVLTRQDVWKIFDRVLKVVNLLFRNLFIVPRVGNIIFSEKIIKDKTGNLYKEVVLFVILPVKDITQKIVFRDNLVSVIVIIRPCILVQERLFMRYRIQISHSIFIIIILFLCCLFSISSYIFVIFILHSFLYVFKFQC